MIAFLLKKTFFDHWDNFFKLTLINLGFVVSLVVPIFVPPFFESVPFARILFLLAGILWCFVYLSAAALSLKTVSDYDSFEFMEFFRNIRIAWPEGLVLGGIVFFAYILCTTAIPFYLSMESIIGLMLAALIFWTLVTAALALQFFFVVRFRMGSSLAGALVKCFIIFFDNPMFCIFSLVYNVLMLSLSMLTALLVPGPSGALLFLDQGLRLRLKKYDWLEANAEVDHRAVSHEAVSHKAAGRHKIPWDSILIEEKEKTGNRSIKSFIFPWKD